MLEHGNLSGRPVSAPLGDGIFELRANETRLLFYFESGQRIVFVHYLLKKTRRVPQSAIRLAKDRRAIIRAQGVCINAIPN